MAHPESWISQFSAETEKTVVYSITTGNITCAAWTENNLQLPLPGDLHFPVQPFEQPRRQISDIYSAFKKKRYFMSQLIQILGVQLFSFFICTRSERWYSLCQLAHNHPLWPSDGKSSFSDSLSQERDVFHTFPQKNLLQVRCLFQQGLTATIDSD